MSTNSPSHIHFNSWTEGRGSFAIAGQVIFSKSKCSMQEGKGEDTDEPQEGYSGSELYPGSSPAITCSSLKWKLSTRGGEKKQCWGGKGDQRAQQSSLYIGARISKGETGDQLVEDPTKNGLVPSKSKRCIHKLEGQSPPTRQLWTRYY